MYQKRVAKGLSWIFRESAANVIDTDVRCVCGSVHSRAVESVSRWTSTSVLMSVFTPATDRTSVRLTPVARSLLSRPTSSHTSSRTPNRSELLSVSCQSQLCRRVYY